MRITDYITVTELSRLTKKTRPTIYKYINEYDLENYDEVPYSIKILFDMIYSTGTTKEDIIRYCSEKFGDLSTENEKIKEIVLLLKENYGKLNLEEIKEFIKERIKTNEKE